MRLSIRFRWIPFIATLAVVAIGVSLGNWQQRRAAEKQGIEGQIAARSEMPPLAASALPRAAVPEEFRRIVVEGEFVAGWPLYLENRPQDGKAGFHLVMPMRVAGSEQAVLVLRGWFPRDVRDRARIPDIPVPQGTVRIEGRVRSGISRTLQMGEPVVPQPRAIVQNLAVGEVAAASGLPLQTFIIEQTSDTGDGLVRDWPTPAAGIDKHRGYAFQWYALAAAALLFFLVTGLRSGSKPSS